MSDVFIFIHIEMPITGIENALYLLEYARSQSNKTVQHAFVREFKSSRQQQCRFGYDTKNSKRKVVCAGEKDLDDQKHQKSRSSVFVKNLAKPKEIFAKDMSGNPDSTNNSLVHPEERLDNGTLQAITFSDHKGREDKRKSKPK